MNASLLQAVVQGTDDAIWGAARKIKHLVKNPDLFGVEIGLMVDQSVRRSDGGYSADALNELAKLCGVPARKLGAFHESALVERVAGVSAYLPGGISYDLFRQFARVLKADGCLEWKKGAILRVAAQVSRGLPSYMAGRVIDNMLGGCRSIETRYSSEPWNYRILSEVAMEIEAFVAVQPVAA